jgi:ABC-type Fe3+-hydroxamate transport system substrate-binding protein
MPVFYDQLGKSVNLPSVPKRIVSLVPSQTELLFKLGLDSELVGITKFCIHPHEKVRSKIHIGGTKQLNVPLIKKIAPDLIIANKEENDKGQIEGLMTLYPVWVSDINNLSSALQMINGVGEIVSRVTEAKLLIDLIEKSFTKLHQVDDLRVAYLIWRKPYMAAGQGTFINAIQHERYPVISADDIVNAKPDILFLSSEPYPFSLKHLTEFQKMLPSTKILLVDGEMFSWYGSHLLDASAYFNSVIQSLK